MLFKVIFRPQFDYLCKVVSVLAVMLLLMTGIVANYTKTKKPNCN